MNMRIVSRPQKNLHAYGPSTVSRRRALPFLQPRAKAPLVHEWRRRIGEAFCLAPGPVDPACAQREARAHAERKCNFEVVAGVREALIAGHLSPLDAARALTDEADQCVQAMLQIALDGMNCDYGLAPGRFTVLGLGKFGGCELTLGSDLDVIFVYEPSSADDELAAADYFVRLGQRLIRDLYRSPGWQALYEVDLRLRPHGEDSPLSTPFTGLVNYLTHDCWIWELQALTRLRPIAGDLSLAHRVQAAAREAMAGQSGRADLLDQVADMRALMDQERPGHGVWDVKLAAGGLVDIEFIVQALHLRGAADLIGAPPPNTGEALGFLGAQGALPPRTVKALHTAWTLYSQLRQIQTAIGTDDFDRAPPSQKAQLLGVLDCRSIGALKARLCVTQARVRALFESLVGQVKLDQAA